MINVVLEFISGW